LQANLSAVRSVLSQRAAATTYALDYDCSVFDQHGFCVSVGFRNTQIGSNYADSGETAGLLTAAYRVTQELRIGGFIDQNLVSNSPTGVNTKNTQPMLGAFAVYQENPNFSGLTIRAALAYQEGDLRITRPELTDTEAGTGRARTSAFAFGGEIAYGFPLDGTWVAQPYAGLRRSDSQRRGYTETTSADVEFPITYNRFGQTVTSGTAGLRLRGAISPEFSLTLGAGMEYDLDSKMDRYSGTSTIPDLERFSINASQQQNEVRAVGSAGMRYMIASNQALAFDASVRQMPYGNDPSITTMLRYSIGF
jgi:outer membrane autotransporter protein